MHPKNHFLYGIFLGILVGVLVYLARPARLLSAKVTAVAPGTPALASVALHYGQGLPPASVIVDLQGRDGHAGSATIDGQQLLIEIPLASPPDASYHVTATATYRILGRLWTRVCEFGIGELRIEN